MADFGKEPLTTKEKGYVRMRSLMDIGMGTLWVCLSIYIMFIKYFTPDVTVRLDPLSLKIFGGLCVVYGIFRIYRGIKKNYFTER